LTKAEKRDDIIFSGDQVFTDAASDLSKDDFFGILG